MHCGAEDERYDGSSLDLYINRHWAHPSTAQVTTIAALWKNILNIYVQGFPIFRKLKTNYPNVKKMFHFNLLPCVFTENET